MRCLVLFIVVLTSVSLTSAQQSRSQSAAPYQPAVPPPSMGVYGGGAGYGYGGGAGTTPAGSAMTGMSNVISAKGDFALSTSAAAVNMTQAQKQEIQNRQEYTNTYFDMRATNKQARAAEEGPRATMEQLARIAHEDAPKALSPGEMNEVTGKLSWPQALQLDSYAAGRKKLEELFGTYSQMGNLNYADQVKARQIISTMNDQLKAQIRTIPATDYTTCKRFLKSLMYTTCKAQLG